MEATGGGCCCRSRAGGLWRRDYRGGQPDLLATEQGPTATTTQQQSEPEGAGAEDSPDDEADRRIDVSDRFGVSIAERGEEETLQDHDGEVTSRWTLHALSSDDWASEFAVASVEIWQEVQEGTLPTIDTIVEDFGIVGIEADRSVFATDIGSWTVLTVAGTNTRTAIVGDTGKFTLKVTADELDSEQFEEVLRSVQW